MTMMNESDKHAFLREMLRSGEHYQAEVWGNITADKKTQLMFSSMPVNMMLAESYCYIGMTEENLNVVVVNTQQPDKILGRLRLPFDRITSASVKGSLIPGRKTVELIVDGRAVRLKLNPGTTGTDLQNQKEGIRKITERFRLLYTK